MSVNTRKPAATADHTSDAADAQKPHLIRWIDTLQHLKSDDLVRDANGVLYLRALVLPGLRR